MGAARRGVGLGQTREMFMLLGAKLLMLLLLLLLMFMLEFPTLSRGRGTMSWVLVKGIPSLTV